MEQVDFMDEATFLYCEETILAERLRLVNYKCACALSASVIHNHSDSAVSNALMWLKQNNPDFIQVRKGEYSLRQHDSEEEMNMQFKNFDDIVNRLTHYMKKLNQFNWRKCSDAEWKEARRKMKVLEKLNGDLDRLLEGKK